MQETIFPYINPLIQFSIVVTMVSIGMQVTGAQIIGAVSNIGLMTRALLANLIILPLVAVMLVWMFSVPQGLAIGFLLVAASPGAPLIPKLAEVARANLPFAVGLMFILAVLAIVTTPLTASVILPLDENIQFDTLRVIQSLIILQLIPLFSGLGIQRWLPKVKGVLLRPLILLVNLSIVVIIALVVWRDHQTLFALPWTTVLAMLLLIGCALLSGWLLGGPQTGTRKALALGTSAQSNGLALLIASLNFPGMGADIAVVAFGVLNIVINFAVAVYWGRERG